MSASGVSQGQHALDQKWGVRVHIYVRVPVYEAVYAELRVLAHAGGFIATRSRDTHNRGDSVYCLENLVQGRVLTDVPHGLIVVHLRHAGMGPDGVRPVPAFGVMAARPSVLEYVVDHTLEEL